MDNPLFDGMAEATASAMGRIGGEVVEAIGRSLDSAYPPPSEPGTPPHRRTGTLRGSTSYSVDATGDSVTLTVGNDCPYAAHLEYGTARAAPRPFFSPARDEWAEKIPDLLARAVGGSPDAG